MEAPQSSAFASRVLGRTGLSVGALGIASSYGVPTAAIERAFEEGANYLYWGSRRRAAFGQAIRNLASRRDGMVLALQSYSRFPRLLTASVERALRELKLERTDILLLGFWNHAIPGRIMDGARRLKERGLVRFLGVSSHNRSFVPVLARTPDIDVLHVRYNAVHRGAEREVFPLLPERDRPGVVSFTATSWKQLLGSRRIPPGERVPCAADCYRFVLSHPGVDVCMSGPARAEHVDDLVAAMHGGPMREDELAWMRRVGDGIYGRSR
jgi:aryl-alcohol dehydrogenase-like predicted oxidoreductase